jgi:hypothetical protein
MRQFPANDKHGEFPDEKGKLDTKTKLLVNTTREVILAILDGKTEVKLKRYKKNVRINHLPRKPGKTESFTHKIKNHYKPIATTETPITRTKSTVHLALEQVGIDKTNTNKRIATVIESLWSQYEHMLIERFLHRMENGKVLRDARFLLGVPYLLWGEWIESRKETLEDLKSKHNFQNLIDSKDARANNALDKLLKTTRKYLKKEYREKWKEKYAEFITNLKSSIDGFHEKLLTSYTRDIS